MSGLQTHSAVKNCTATIRELHPKYPPATIPSVMKRLSQNSNLKGPVAAGEWRRRPRIFEAAPDRGGIAASGGSIRTGFKII